MEKNKQNDNLLFENQKIVDIGMEKEVKQSFIEYSMSVIMSRALPDVRDGMKPGQRRVLYAMFEDNLTHDKPFRKSATTVGNVLGRYHPHGDASVYGTMVRMCSFVKLSAMMQIYKTINIYFEIRYICFSIIQDHQPFFTMLAA